MSEHEDGATKGNWFLAYRTPEGLELWKRHRPAFFLAYIIGTRARYSDDFNEHGLQMGEAFIGDWEACGMTEQEYKTAKTILQKNGFATFKPTNKGTIARLTKPRLFWLIGLQSNDQNNDQLTTKVTVNQRSTNERVTTNNKERAVRTEKGESEILPQRVCVSEQKNDFAHHQWKGEPDAQFIARLKKQIDGINFRLRDITVGGHGTVPIATVYGAEWLKLKASKTRHQNMLRRRERIR